MSKRNVEVRSKSSKWAAKEAISIKLYLYKFCRFFISAAKYSCRDLRQLSDAPQHQTTFTKQSTEKRNIVRSAKDENNIELFLSIKSENYSLL